MKWLWILAAIAVGYWVLPMVLGGRKTAGG